jgi:NADPH:quinone reductase-like Zn-dependent oxidoreductase
MKAIVLRDLGSPDNLRIEEAPDPVAGAGQVVVRLKAAALNHRDLWIWKGQYAGIKLPIILGSDGAGVVESVGAGVDASFVGREVVINPALDWGKDDRCFGPDFRILGLPDDGTYAERVAVPVGNIQPKPAGLTWGEAAAVPLAGLTAYRAVASRAQVREGETVLIPGIGSGVATFALQFARHLGARVFVTSGTDAKLDRARELGAEGGVNYKSGDWAARILALMGGEGPDVVIDSVGGETFNACVELLKPGGRIVTFGATTGPAPQLEIRRVFWKQLSLLGTTMGTPAEFAAMLSVVESGHIKPVVDQVFPLADAAAAHRRMEEAGQFGKIVLAID